MRKILKIKLSYSVFACSIWCILNWIMLQEMPRNSSQHWIRFWHEPSGNKRQPEPVLTEIRCHRVPLGALLEISLENLSGLGNELSSQSMLLMPEKLSDRPVFIKSRPMFWHYITHWLGGNELIMLWHFLICKCQSFFTTLTSKSSVFMYIIQMWISWWWLPHAIWSGKTRAFLYIRNII